MLSFDEKQELMNRFPNVKLSYEKLLHKKVYADIYALIPKGPKSFIWFTYIGNKNVALSMITDKRGVINSINPILLNFDSSLSHGTLVYGTIFNVKNTKFFTIEDILVYENNNVENYSFLEKLKKIDYLLNKKIMHSKFNTINIGLPIIKNSIFEAHENISLLPYQIYSIHVYKNLTSVNPMGKYLVKNDFVRKANFFVKATLDPDIYHLYCLCNDKQHYYDIAMVPSYKKSTELNSIFRNIKENTNLDFLEESDSDDDFENICEDKYVDLNKTVKMECVYMNNFKKWCPLQINEEQNTINLNELRNIEI
tara:strand:+ start:262 stop:1191 length:930 start_codon:yes stop_codon:yes gene_type:complete